MESRGGQTERWTDRGRAEEEEDLGRLRTAPLLLHSEINPVKAAEPAAVTPGPSSDTDPEARGSAVPQCSEPGSVLLLGTARSRKNPPEKKKKSADRKPQREAAAPEGSGLGSGARSPPEEPKSPSEQSASGRRAPPRTEEEQEIRRCVSANAPRLGNVRRRRKRRKRSRSTGVLGWTGPDWTGPPPIRTARLGSAPVCC